MKNDINKGIICNVKNCVFNEKGSNCNLERVTISKGEGEHHFCKSYISNNDSSFQENLQVEDKLSSSNVEASDEYFSFEDLLNDVTQVEDDKFRDNH